MTYFLYAVDGEIGDLERELKRGSAGLTPAAIEKRGRLLHRDDKGRRRSVYEDPYFREESQARRVAARAARRLAR